MIKLQNKQQINRLALLISVTYMTSYITRINYGAIIVEMEAATQISKSLLSMAVTGSFITYGAGQIVSGICGDRFSPKKLISYGLTLSILMNLLIPICISPYQMLAVWCVNGFAQAFMWPPLVRIMSALLSAEDYKNTVVKGSWGSSIGTIIVYMLSPVIISTLGWKAVFLFSAMCGIIMLFVWNKYAYEIEPERKRVAVERKSSTHMLFNPLMICIMVAIILQGMLRDGVTTWMPSYISETYHLSSSISILTGVVLPIFSIICLQITSKLYRKIFTNPIMCAGIIFGASTISALALLLFTGQNAALSVVSSAMLTGCMHGVNLMLICMIPPFFEKHGNVSTVSGVLNACTYIGSAISTYGVALLSERFSWEYTLFIWMLIGLLGTVLCLVSVKPWKKTIEN